MMQASSSQESTGAYTRAMVKSEMLRTLRNDPTAEVRLAALAALVLQEQHKRGVPHDVVKALCKVSRNDPDPKVQIAAIDAMTQLMLKGLKRPSPLRYTANRERVRSMPSRITKVWRRTREEIVGLPSVLTAVAFIIYWVSTELHDLWTLFFR